MLEETYNHTYEEYGFEPLNTEHKIRLLYKNSNNIIIGHIQDTNESIRWSDKGICMTHPFDLKRIAWWKDVTNEGKLIINKYGEVRIIQSIYNNKISTHIQNLYEDAIIANGWRLVTSDEVKNMIK